MTTTSWRWVGIGGVAALLAGCSGASAPAAAALDGALDGAMPHPDADAPPLAPREAECGDTVDATGSLYGRPFTAGYIHTSYRGGDCTEVAEIVIAASSAPESASLMIMLTRDPVTHSFIAHTTPLVRVFPTDRSEAEVGADVDVTMFPDPLGGDPDASMSSMAATFSVASGGVSVTGMFSGPLCRTAICI
jgi:hypothetical protein